LPDGVTASAFAYRHRFAEPFSDLTAQLVLQALPGTGSATYVYALSGLLVAATVLGLAALYQSVSVVVGFAERRSNFVAAVSHELKTPLTAIRMYGEMLRDGMVPSDTKRNEYYRHITAESERLSRLINNVLEFSRLEKGNREVVLVTGAVEPVVRDVAELLRPHVEGHGFELQVEIDTDLPAFRFERDALMQVLWNLADNAVKYARDAVPKRIVLRCRNEGGLVAVSVVDHGPGVAARHLDKIFDPFYRGESELTRRNKGTGLGLALVRGLAERMGATVTGSNVAEGGFEVKVLFHPARA
jgi:signal transduction histidine kinase